ncbi:MAG: hypothetical protein V4659_08870 [Pseudomonadota bacterium]
MSFFRRAALLLSLVISPVLQAQGPADRPPAPVVLPPYPEYAALALAAPIVADAKIRSTDRVKGAQAVGLGAGLARVYVTADITTLIRGPAGLPARLSYLVDMPLDARGRAASLNKARVLIFARALPGRPGMLQLVAPDGQRPWTPGGDRRVRAILTEALDAAAPPAVTGVGSAFFVPGGLPGEGETQVFLQTADGRPVSLSILRDFAGRRRWSVALSEIVDAAAPPPPRETLLWYRLACSLPATLPAASAVDDDPANAARAREDYRFVIDSLGPCR